MSYTPTNWATGDVITAEKLNKLEQGVASAGGVTVVPYVSGGMDNPNVIQMKASELLTACQNGVVFIKEVASGDDEIIAACDLVYSAEYFEGGYSFSAGTAIYSAASGDDYPASDGGK